MVEGLSRRLTQQMPGPVTVLATGGFASSIARLSPVFDHVLPSLLLDGLRALYYNVFRSSSDPCPAGGAIFSQS